MNASIFIPNPNPNSNTLTTSGPFPYPYDFLNPFTDWYFMWIVGKVTFGVLTAIAIYDNWRRLSTIFFAVKQYFCPTISPPDTGSDRASVTSASFTSAPPLSESDSDDDGVGLDGASATVGDDVSASVGGSAAFAFAEEILLASFDSDGDESE